MGITFAQTSVLQGVNSKHIMVRHHFGAESASRQKKKKILIMKQTSQLGISSNLYFICTH